jgi:hypothetical protein
MIHASTAWNPRLCTTLRHGAALRLEANGQQDVSCEFFCAHSPLRRSVDCPIETDAAGGCEVRQRQDARSGSNPSAVNALRELVELIGKSTQSGAGRLGVGSAGKPPQERSVVVIAQSVFFWLLRHRSVPLLLPSTGHELTMFPLAGSLSLVSVPRYELKLRKMLSNGQALHDGGTSGRQSRRKHWRARASLYGHRARSLGARSSDDLVPVAKLSVASSPSSGGRNPNGHGDCCRERRVLQQVGNARRKPPAPRLLTGFGSNSG